MLHRRAVLGLAAAAPLAVGCHTRRTTATTAPGRVVLRPAEQRGARDLGWLQARFSFSFADYRDPDHMGFRALRVLNEDRIAGGGGFPLHPHREMEILTYVLDGALEHKDTLGNGSVIRPGHVQRMSAGTGIRHSEFNPSPSERTHLLQIWLHPHTTGMAPSYEETILPAGARDGTLRLIASRDGRDAAVTIHTDLNLYATVLKAGESAAVSIERGRHAWIQVARGRLVFGEHTLRAGDGAAVSETERLELVAAEASEALVFDLA